jgi:hypothetical protein
VAASELSKVCVDIETDLIDRFREIYPQHGAIKWFFNEALRAFIEIHDPEKVPDEIRQAAQAALDSNYEEEDLHESNLP